MKSSRIKRRNACGFVGVGTSPKWVKTTSHGTYSNGKVRMADKAREIGKNANRTKLIRDRIRKSELRLLPQ